MANKKIKINVDLDFTSDQMSIEKIKKQIDTAISAVKINLDPQSAKKFEAELKELGGLLQKHLNPNTGKINAKNFVADLDNRENFQMIEKLGQRYAEVGVHGQQSFRKIANEADFLNKKIGSSNKTLEKMGTTLMNTIRWNISSSVVNAVTGEFQKMYYFAKDLDRTLTDIRIVSGQSADQMERFALHANESAKALGVTTIEYGKAATLFFQQGLGEADVKKMTDGAVMASRITGVAAADMADLLTSTMNGYKLAADEVTTVTDKLAAVGATTASNFEELSTGMSKVASMANTAGVTIDELNAQLATIIAVTRESPESIGTSLKTIYGRMLMFKTDTKALMEDDDGEVFGAPKVEEALQAYNKVSGAQISLFKTTADGRRELRDLGEVIEEIGESWDTVTDRTAKFGVATALAGSRQQNRLVALFDSWDMYKDAVETSLNAEGTTLQQNAIYMESYEGKLKGLQAAKEELYMVLTDSDSMKFFIGALTEGVQLFTKLADMAGGFSGVLGIIGVAFSDNLVKKAYEFQQAFVIPEEMKISGKENEQIQSLKELHRISKVFGADEANRYREDLRNKTAVLKEMKRESQLLIEKQNLLVDISEVAEFGDNEAKKKAVSDSLITEAAARGVAVQSAEELRVKYNELAEAERNLKELEQLSYGEVIGDQIHRDVEVAQTVVDGLQTQIDSIHEKATEAATRGVKAYKEIESQTGETSSEISAKAKEAERLKLATQATRAAFMLLPAAISGATDSSKSLNEVIKNIGMLSIPSLVSALKPVIVSLGVAKDAAGAFNASMLLAPGIIAGITLATMALAAIIKTIKGDTKAAAEAAAEYKDSSDAVDNYTKRYENLQKALKAAKGNEEETYNVKKQLLELQTELNEKFGDEYGKLNLVTDAYKDQTDAIKNYNREAAKALLNDIGTKEQRRAEEAMTSEQLYNLNVGGTSVYSEEGKALQKLISEYSDRGISPDERDGMLWIRLHADPTSAEQTIDEFMTDVRSLAKELGNEDIFDEVLDISGVAKAEAQSIISEWGDIWDSVQLGHIAEDDNLTNQMNEAIEAVNAYNEAVLRSENPFDDIDVSNAYDDLQLIKQEIDSTEEWDRYALVIGEVFDSASTDAYDFYNSIKDNLDKISTEFKGLSDDDLRAMADDDIDDSFDALLESAQGYGIELEELIDLLVQLDIVQRKVASESVTSFKFDFKSFSEDIDSMQSAYNTLTSAMEEYNEYGAYSLDTLQSLLELEPQYLAMLELENGQLVLNESAMQGVINAKLNTAQANLYEEATAELNRLANEALGIATDEVTNTSGSYVGASGDRANATATEASTALVAAEAYNLMNQAATGAKTAGVDQSKINEIVSNTNAKVAALNKAISGVNFNLGGAAKGFANMGNSAKKAGDKAGKAADKASKAVDGLKDKVKSLNDELDKYKQAHSAVIRLLDDEINKLQELVDLERERLETQKDTMDSALSAIDRVYEDEIDRLQKLVDLEQSRLDKKKDAYDSALRAIDKLYTDEIDKLQELVDLEQKRLDKKKDNYDSTLSAVDKLYSDEIDRIEEQKEAVEESYNEKMDLIQAEIDALQDKNDETSKEIALEKAKLNLHNAQNQRNKLIYDKDKGYVFTTDQSTINEAKEGMQQAELDLRLYNLNKLKDELNNSLAEEVEILDNSIKVLNEYKEQWADVSSQYTDAQNAMIASQTLGANWEEDLLNGRMDNYDSFLEDYNSVQAQLNDLEDETTANQERIKQLEEYKQKWADVVDSYSTGQDKLSAVQLLGKNWEQDLLNGRLDNLNSFLIEYDRIQVQLTDVSKEKTANQLRIIEMEKYRQKWADVVDSYDREQDKLSAVQLLGKNWEEDLLNGRTDNLDSFLEDYNRIQAQLTDISKEQTANQERIKQLEEYKQKWADVVNEYDRQQDKLMASQLIGANWEADILGGRISTLTKFKDDYISLQKQISDTQDKINQSARDAESAAGRVATASQKASDAIKSMAQTDKNTEVKMVDDKVFARYVNQGGPNNWVKLSTYAKGGVVSLGNDYLNSLARSVGEDTMVAVKEGERILTPQQNESYEKLINMSESIINSGVARMFGQYQSYSPASLQPINKTSQQAVTFTGDIVLHGVQNPEQFGKALKLNIGNIIKQNFD